MLYSKLYPTSSYISSYRKDNSFYYKNTLLVGNYLYGDIHYISLLKFSDLKDINKDIEVINAYLNLYLTDEFNSSIEELRRLFVLFKIDENFNLEDTTWNNTPRLSSLNLDKRDFSYDSKENIVSFNITPLIKELSENGNYTYGLALMSRPGINASLFKFYSSNSNKQPYILVNYEKCNNQNRRIAEIIFKEREFDVQSLDNIFNSPNIDISNFNTGTYFIKNKSTSNVMAYLQVSPNGIDFTDDVVEVEVKANDTAALALAKFLKFSRIRFVNSSPNPNSNITVWFQGQTFDYYIR
ncbi:DNRLRE domain-containing protein [Clostridium tertium]|uniref:DNRLRE domain-containing protein n=1 Tax=Clostridium tertium TaxID=1559 RepID=A0A6N2YFR7_9CLOT